MSFLQRVLEKLLGPQPEIDKYDCDQCGAKDSTGFLIGVHKHPNDKYGFKFCLRYYIKCLGRQGKNCNPRYITDPVSDELIAQYAVLYEIAKELDANTKNNRAALATALEKVNFAKFLVEETLEEARAAVIAGQAAEKIAKRLGEAVDAAAKATANASTKLAGTTSVVKRKPSKSSGATGGSSPAKRKSDTDSSPCDRTKRARTNAGAVASTSKAPVAGSSKKPDNGKGKAKAEATEDDSSVINLCTDDES
ncbi:hypothetical protein AURDEDRAFT_176452 [Auricularia subglabra TFB-10046 SS5]|uniref:Uncharacterized protein n=1 Tax=Auricularia subglabra (strain TFB-10046 / SS5) TaxID=717982 RepID=J0CVR2_AURST|nr:hypothetical protein AURDEDRAFT_176452 [Auricularia subglabra TFB-10046 SS5]